MDEQDLEISIELQEEIAEEEDTNSYIRMDYSIESPEERVKLVEKIIAKTPPERLTNRYKEKLADYMIFAMDKQQRKQNSILTDNHMVTVNKRETSFEGLVGRLENGEDGIYSMITNDKNIIFSPKVEITEKDLKEIPHLRELHDSIEKLEEQFKNTRGKKAYLLKKQIIELRQDQYVIKNTYKKPIYNNNSSAAIPKTLKKVDLTEHFSISPNGEPQSDGVVTFFNPKHISLLLCNYFKIKESSWADLNGDAKWFMMDLDNLINKTFKDYPLYYDLLTYKINGLQNIDIQELLYQKHGVKHSVEYISSLWRNKIPKMIAEEAKREYIVWHYTNVEKGYWKKCSKCGQIKLGHNYFFSKNRTSKDGWYSICKECRNKKVKK